jgi:mRNA interferase MazF
MTYKPWDIVLVPFPFTNLSTNKKRPVLIISPAEYNKGYDAIIMFITSNLSALERPGDYRLEEWKEAGLPKPSMTRMKLATVDKNIIIKKIAHLEETDQKAVKEIIADFFDVL